MTIALLTVTCGLHKLLAMQYSVVQLAKPVTAFCKSVFYVLVYSGVRKKNNTPKVGELIDRFEFVLIYLL